MGGKGVGGVYNPDKRDPERLRRALESTTVQPCPTWGEMVSLKAWKMGDKTKGEEAIPSSELENLQHTPG